MTEKIDFDESEAFLRWAICELIGTNINIVHNTDEDLMVEMRINGVELSFKGLIDRLEENFDVLVERTAKRLLVDTVQESVDKMMESVEYFGEEIRSKAKKLHSENNDGEIPWWAYDE
jgi:hypothetical protein